MADRKRQHFVPKLLLRRFAPDTSGRSINLVNLRDGKVVKRASLKTQCYRDYFYGIDGILEEGLGSFEGHLSAFLNDVVQAPSILSIPSARTFAALLLAMQRGRTAEAERRIVETIAEMEALIFEGDSAKAREFLGGELLNPVVMSLTIQISNSPMFWDMKYCIVSNDSETEFIIGDNPVIFANRFWVERHNNNSIGMSSSGLSIIMPVSATKAIMAYDGNVYTVPTKVGHVVEATSDDVHHLNVAQAVSALTNIYFRGDEMEAWFSDSSEEIARRRASPKSATTELIEVEPGVFREGRREDSLKREDGTSSTLMVTSQLKPDITMRWSFLKFRSSPKYYDDGSAAGAVRDRAWIDIVEEFSERVRMGRAPWGELTTFAVSHPLFSKVGPWKRAYFV